MSRAWFLALCVLALAQIGAASLRCELVQAISAATVASPAPKVFTSNDGLESFSSRYTLEGIDAMGHRRTLTLDAAQTDALRGPYNRRNPYGAVLAFAPVLSANRHTQAMFESVTQYGLCGDGPMLRELGFDPGPLPRRFTIVHVPRTGTRTSLPLRTSVSCR